VFVLILSIKTNTSYFKYWKYKQAIIAQNQLNRAMESLSSTLITCKMNFYTVMYYSTPLITHHKFK